MSEFRQASAHVEALETRLALLQESVGDRTSNDELEESFRFILAAIDGDVDVTMEGFRDRCSMVDPVTKQPRFGPKMLLKVQDLLRRYDDVKLAVEEDAPLRQQVQSQIYQLTEEEAAKKLEEEARRKEKKELQSAAELAQQQEQERMQLEIRERQFEQQREEQRRIEALAVAAQEKREQRQKERIEEERQRQVEKEERERLNASIPHGKEGLEKAIVMLRESTGSEALFRQSLQKLQVVVHNICSSPETPAFRHIPKENVHFHADLGQYPGGHQCLLALGFKELEQGDEAESRAVFVLEEPDLSADIDAWSNWFDELTEMKSLVESKL